MRLKLERIESGQSHVPQFSHEVAREVNQIRDESVPWHAPLVAPGICCGLSWAKAINEISILKLHLPRIVKWCQWPVWGLYTDSEHGHTIDIPREWTDAFFLLRRLIAIILSWHQSGRIETVQTLVHSACILCSQRCAGLQTSRKGTRGQCTTLMPLRHQDFLSHHTVFSRHACCLDSRTHVSRRRVSAEDAAGSGRVPTRAVVTPSVDSYMLPPVLTYHFSILLHHACGLNCPSPALSPICRNRKPCPCLRKHGARGSKRRTRIERK